MTEYLIQESTLTAIADAVRAKTKKTDAILVSDLVNEITGISTGVELNFDVVGGTTQPANPKENTIWVETDVPITSYIFSATEPEAPEDGKDGMVWITTVTSSSVEFNALKKNGIQVYPISAKQYIGGAWVEKTAKSWQGGKWVEWCTYLYSPGNEWDNITGGWTVQPTSIISGFIGITPSMENTNDGIVISGSFAQTQSTELCHKQAVDLGKYEKIIIEFDSESTSSDFSAALYVRPVNSDKIAEVEIMRGGNITGNKTLDISSIPTGSYIVYILIWTTTGGNLNFKLKFLKCLVR